jgi:hypothetical protein
MQCRQVQIPHILPELLLEIVELGTSPNLSDMDQVLV